MRRTRIIPGLSLVLVIGAACDEPDGVTDVAEDPAVEPHDAPIEPKAGGSVVTELETPTGGRLQFIELTAGSPGGILIVEEGDAGTLVTERIFAAAGEALNAAELYASLIDPADDESGIPQRLLDLSNVSSTSRPNGWALELLQHESGPALLSSASALSSAPIACNNANFTGSIGGGFLAHKKKRLDTGPDFHPNLWVSYPFYAGPWPHPYDFYWYRAVGWATNTSRWRGKVCGKAGTRPPVAPIYEGHTFVNFVYRYGGQWWRAGDGVGFRHDEGRKVATWYYNGELGPLDWDIGIYDAYVFDEFDLLMTFN